MTYHSKMEQEKQEGIMDLANTIEDVFGVDIFDKTRRREIVDARMAVMVAVRRMYTTVEIAKSFGMDHSSVVHASKQHKSKYNANPAKRYRMFRAYCDIYDFCVSRILDKNFKEYETITDVREQLADSKRLCNDLQHQIREIELELKQSKKQIADLEKYRVGFKQVITETKLKNEKAN